MLSFILSPPILFRVSYSVSMFTTWNPPFLRSLIRLYSSTPPDFFMSIDSNSGTWELIRFPILGLEFPSNMLLFWFNIVPLDSGSSFNSYLPTTLCLWIAEGFWVIQSAAWLPAYDSACVLMFRSEDYPCLVESLLYLIGKKQRNIRELLTLQIDCSSGSTGDRMSILVLA